jgi:hypothetical protein
MTPMMVVKPARVVVGPVVVGPVVAAAAVCRDSGASAGSWQWY